MFYSNARPKMRNLNVGKRILSMNGLVYRPGPVVQNVDIVIHRIVIFVTATGKHKTPLWQ